MCPGWLKLSRERTRFEVIQDRAKIVRSIFEDSTSGLGHYIIVKRLNEFARFAFRSRQKNETRNARVVHVFGQGNPREPCGAW